MAKLSLTTILSGLFSSSALNQNFTDIENEFQSGVLYRDNPVGEPNDMMNDLDMGGYSIINAGSIGYGGAVTLTAAGRVAANGTSLGTPVGGTIARTSAGLYRLTLTTAATSADNLIVNLTMEKPTDDKLKSITYNVISATEIDVITQDEADLAEDQAFSYMVYDRS